MQAFDAKTLGEFGTAVVDLIMTAAGIQPFAVPEGMEELDTLPGAFGEATKKSKPKKSAKAKALERSAPALILFQSSSCALW